jgi:hypothetical protein
VLESVLPPWNSGGHFNCWPAFLFGATETIMLAHHGFKLWTPLLLGRTAAKASDPLAIALMAAISARR